MLTGSRYRIAERRAVLLWLHASVLGARRLVRFARLDCAVLATGTADAWRYGALNGLSCVLCVRHGFLRCVLRDLPSLLCDFCGAFGDVFTEVLGRRPNFADRALGGSSQGGTIRRDSECQHARDG